MLKLIYHTTVFGPIEFEYDQPIIRVGRAEDNDLVLRHPSVEPHHCLLAFRGEKVLCLPPSQADLSQIDVSCLRGSELGAGDVLRIGGLQFSLAHSTRTVALPEVRGQGSTAEDTARNGMAREARYYCAHCRKFIRDSDVKRVGLVGHAKRNLCPKCSRLLETEAEPSGGSGMGEEVVEGTQGCVIFRPPSSG